jgi:hypothetical protein
MKLQLIVRTGAIDEWINKFKKDYERRTDLIKDENEELLSALESTGRNT